MVDITIPQNLTQLQDLLKKLPPGSTLQLTKLPGGGLAVARTDYATKQEYLAAEFSDLIDVPITVKAAVDKYDVPDQTIRNWIGIDYVTVLDPEARPYTINEAEVAYCARLYHERRKNHASGAGGAPLLDPATGLPYALKHPELAKQRRRQRRKKQ